MKKYENLFWYREKDTIRTATAYHSDKQAKSLQSKYGGNILTKIELPFDPPFEDASLVGFGQWAGNKKPQLPFSIYVVDAKESTELRFLISVNNRSNAFDILRAVAPSVHAVLVFEAIMPHEEVSFEF